MHRRLFENRNLEKNKTGRSGPRIILGMSLLLGLILIVIIIVPSGGGHALARSGPTTAPFAPETQSDHGDGPNADCLMCHSNPDFKGEFQNAELISLFVSNGEYRQSVHGVAGLECVACHMEISRYPHHQQEQINCLSCHDTEGGSQDSVATLRISLPYKDRREMSLAINESCRSCHAHEFDIAVDSAHVKVFDSGNLNAPVCIDCHGSHDITTAGTPRQKISQTCAKCHQAVYSSYQYSIHGTALEDESNPDVPTCVDCHGVHNVRGPRDLSFRGDSITICGGCHADQEMMGKYGISTEVFTTYLDDFHGRTVDLFRQQEEGISSNKAVCFDCHGIHDIRRPEDPLSSVYPTNLQHTCQQCHQDITIRFPSAWLSHYVPTWEDTPIMFAVTQFYRLLIPLTTGGFILYIGLDARKRWQDRRQIVRQALAEAEDDEYDFTKDN